MKRQCVVSGVLALAVVAILGQRAYANGVIVEGIDLFDTPGAPQCPTSFFLSIPQDFFDPGSDALDEWVQMVGAPIVTSPGGAAGTADTIVQRITPTTGLTCSAGESTVDIVLRALSLLAINPITVTFFGGNAPQLWDLKVCAAPLEMQTTGTMTIRQECEEGGTFDSELPVTPKLLFTRQSDSAPRNFVGPTLVLGALGSNWLHYDPTGNATVSPGLFTVDADCDGVQEPELLPATTNFVPSLKGDVCACSVPPADADALCIGEKKPGAHHQVVCDGCETSGGHFLCYKAKSKTQPAQDPDTVTLTDQFDTGAFDPGRVKLLCTPAAKDGSSPGDPDIHLKSYSLRAVASPSRGHEMRHPPHRVVTTDQFGTFAVKLTSDKHFELMLPTSKSVPPADPPAAPVAGDHFIDHYKCYNSHLDRQASAPFPKDIVVTVEDQFGRRSPVKIGNPRKLCTPVNKNGEGIIDSLTHRTCYRIKLEPFEVPDVQVNNQFGPELLELRTPRLLCLPALKAVGP